MKTKIKINPYFSFRALIILAALAFVVPVTLPSCNDDEFLEEKSLSILVSSNAYSTVVGIRQGIAGLHEYVRRRWYFGEEHQDQGSLWSGGLGTDVAYHGEAPGAVRFFNNYETYIVPSGGEQDVVNFFWEHSYILIQRANYIIEACEELDPAKWENSGQKEAFAAEAKFFRAWAHRNLVSFYGAVPVVDWATKEPKTDYVRDPVEKAYTLMEADLLEGTANLPVRGQEEGAGRITQGAAWHLLCEVYLAQKKYNEAVQAASKVIDGTYGYALMTERFGSANSVWGTGDVFFDLHAMNNHNLATNTEAIWVMQIEPGTNDTRSNGRRGRAFGPAYFRLTHVPDMPEGESASDWAAFRGEQRSGGLALPGGYTGYSDTLGRGVAWIHPTDLSSYLVWEGNWDNDIRNAPHTIKRDYYYDQPKSAFHGKKVNMKEDYASYYAAGTRSLMNDTCQYIYPFFLKVFDPCNVVSSAATSGNGDSYKDFYIMRVADTYLLRAEAYLGLNDQANAARDINAVRARAKAHPVDAADVDIDYLLDERVRELYGEECRHIVLRRTGKLIERVRKYNNNPVRPGIGIMERNVLWPIPLNNQILLNVDNAWQNNPGYPGGPAL